MNCGGLSWWHWLVLGAWQGLEHWLGKTEKVDAGSVPALLFNAAEWTIVTLYSKLRRKG